MTVLNEKSNPLKQDFISEIWEVQSVWEFKEPTAKDKSVIDGKAIIGIVEGQFFVPDGKSRNERFYPKTLWEGVLKSKPIREKLDSLLMFGMIGHEDKSITEEDLRKGDVSHIIADLWIDENNIGMGKAYILNTDAGKNLYIYLKAGAKLKTSSRARGKFVESEKKDGLPIVDTDSFFLETFDFVINPGFEETSATLMEKLMKEKRSDTEMGEQNVNEAVKYLTESSEKLQSQLKSSITEIANLKIEKENILKENKDYSEKLKSFSFLENVDKSIVEALSEFDESDWNSILNSKVKISGALRESSYVHNSISYDAVFIPVKTSKAPLNRFESAVKNTMNEWDKNNVPVDTIFVKKKDNNVFNSNGFLILWKQGQRPMNAVESVTKLVIEENHDLFEGYGVPLTKTFTREQQEMFSKDLSELNKYRSLGTPEEINKALDLSTKTISEYREIGSANEINNLLDKMVLEINSYRELGSVDELSEGLDVLSNSIRSYQELGTVQEIESLLSVVENYATGDSKDLMEKYMRIGTPEDIVSVLSEAKEVVSQYIEIGSVDEINGALDRVEETLSKYVDLGSPEEINEAFEVIIEFTNEVGKPNEIIESLEKTNSLLSKYKALGSPDEINEALDRMVDLHKKTKSNSKNVSESRNIFKTPEPSKIVNISEGKKPQFISESIDSPVLNKSRLQNIFNSISNV